MTKVVVNYGKFKQYGALVDIRSLGIVNGKLVRGLGSGPLPKRITGRRWCGLAHTHP